MTPTHSRRLLIVDDNQAIHDVMRRILQGRPGSTLADAHAALFGGPAAEQRPRFRMDSALQGEDALARAQAALAEQDPYQLAFVDMRMPPGWDGLETTARLMAADPAIYIVICTAYSDASLEEISQKLGPTDRVLILKKPFDPVEVVQLSNALTERWVGQRAASQRALELETIVRDRTAEIQRASMHDKLTGLPNRALFSHRLDAAIARHRADPTRRFAVAFLDLDRFKHINDTFGHACGDQLLVDVAARLKGALRSSDHFTSEPSTSARLGGDEFLVLLTDLRSEHDVALVANRLLATLGRPYNIAGQRLRVSASIGVATSDTPYAAAADLVRDADAAMYRAKAEGRGRFVLFGHDMKTEAMERVAFEADVRQAVDDGLFDLHYQPIVRLADNEIVGFEALLRWRDGKWAGRSASTLVAAAEDAGVAHALNLWALERAARDFRTWSNTGCDVRLNLSGKQLLEPDLLVRVAEVIEDLGGARNLVVEVTEATFVREPTEARSALERLAALGVRTYLDDFGTGHSSLSCLADLPLHGVKLDRAFIGDLSGDPRHARIVGSVIALATACGLDVVAEGVENAADLARLRDLGCHHAQGYWLGREGDNAHVLALLGGTESGND